MLRGQSQLRSLMAAEPSGESLNRASIHTHGFDKTYEQLNHSVFFPLVYVWNLAAVQQTSHMMAAKRPLSVLSIPKAFQRPVCLQCRSLHSGNAAPVRIPKPTPFVPDAQTFLTLIGRNMAQHAAKIPSWETLFSLTSQQLRESGVEPARARRYLLWWRDRFRNGITGIGGDLREVEKGVAELRIVEVPSSRPRDAKATLTKDAGMRKVIVNTPVTVAAMPDPANPKEDTEDVSIVPPPQVDPKTVRPVAGIKIVDGNVIGGTGVEYVKGHPGVARLRVKDGLWEQKRGHKVDGGERRKAEVRAKRRAAERKAAR